MNRSKIEWCDWTWSPLTGCETGCDYCYARRIANRFLPPKGEMRYSSPPVSPGCYVAEEGETYPRGFAPTFYPHRLSEPMKVKKPSRIFCCSMGELFGPWVPNEWVRRIFGTMQDCPWHTFILLTKWPQNILRSLQEAAGDDCPLPNVWLLTSVENQETWDKRVPELLKLREHGWPVLGVSVEPMLGEIEPVGIEYLDWLIVGGQSPASAAQPKREWIDTLAWTRVQRAASGNMAAVFLKNNLRPLLGDNLRQEWPASQWLR